MDVTIKNAAIQMVGTAKCSYLKFLYPVGRSISAIYLDGKKYIPERTCRFDGFEDEGSRLQDKYMYLTCGHEVNAWEPNEIKFCPTCGAEVIINEREDDLERHRPSLPIKRINMLRM